MNIISINQYGDFGIEYTDSIYIGEGILPIFKKGTLKKEIIQTLEYLGYKKTKTKILTFSDDYYWSHEDEEKWKDRQLRLIKGA